MDGQAKKRLEVPRRRLTKPRQQLAGATRQDDPQEVVRPRSEVEAAEAEVRRLRGG